MARQWDLIFKSPFQPNYSMFSRSHHVLGLIPSARFISAHFVPAYFPLPAGLHQAWQQLWTGSEPSLHQAPSEALPWKGCKSFNRRKQLQLRVHCRWWASHTGLPKTAYHRVSTRPPLAAGKRQQFWASADFLRYIWTLPGERNQSGTPLRKGYWALIYQDYSFICSWKLQLLQSTGTGVEGGVRGFDLFIIFF